jgi:hypothetical protein
VRDISEEHLISEFGMDPSAAVMATEGEAISAYVPDRQLPPRPWIRVGEAHRRGRGSAHLSERKRQSSPGPPKRNTTSTPGN